MTPPVIEIFDTELAALAARHEELLQIIGDAKSRLAELEIQTRTLERMRAEIVRIEGRAENGSPGPSEAVLEYLRHHSPSVATAIVEAVAPIIATKSQQRDRLIYNTLLQLTKRGRVVRNGTGFAIAPEHGDLNDRVGDTT